MPLVHNRLGPRSSEMIDFLSVKCFYLYIALSKTNELRKPSFKQWKLTWVYEIYTTQRVVPDVEQGTWLTFQSGRPFFWLSEIFSAPWVMIAWESLLIILRTMSYSELLHDIWWQQIGLKSNPDFSKANQVSHLRWGKDFQLKVKWTS